MIQNKDIMFENFNKVCDALTGGGFAKESLDKINKQSAVREIYAELVFRSPELSRALEGLIKAHNAIVECFENGGKMLLCGNGGSFADCLHISGELLKSFTRNRALREEDKKKFESLPFGEILAENLEYGFPVVVLGANQSLSSAVLNDSNVAKLIFAQECLSLAKGGDILFGISTSGNSENIIMAQSVGKTCGMVNITLAGKSGGKMAENSDIVIYSPGEDTARIQEHQIIIYHALCAGIEAHFYPEFREKQ